VNEEGSCLIADRQELT